MLVMMSLRELQVSFVESLRNPELGTIAEHIVGDGMEPSRRIGIYRNNLHEGFLKTLDAMFPIVRTLGGEDWFRQAGIRYLAEHPSRSGNLHHVGAQFASFLTEYVDTEFEYFADVARLEWAYQECMVAAESSNLDPSALAEVPPDEYGSLQFEIHPAVRLVRSRYPLLAIWKAHQPGGESIQVDLQMGHSNVLIARRDDHVELREIDDPTALALDAFIQGATLSQAAAALMATAPEGDLGQVLNSLFRLNTLAHLKR
jgi:hypothetical protein